MTPGLEQLLLQLQSLPIKEALALLVAQKVTSYGTKGYDQVKKIIQEKWNESRFWFVPSKNEAQKLKSLKNDPDYKTALLLIPRYRYIDVIRTGLLIRYYMKADTIENQEAVSRIKTKLASRPNGKTLLSIVRLMSTPYSSVVFKHLFELQRAGYSEQQLSDEFDGVITNWEESHWPSSSKHTPIAINNFCEQQVKKGNQIFFLLGMKSAKDVVEKTVDELNAKGFFTENNYLVSKSTGFDYADSNEEKVPSVEVTIRKVQPK